MLRLIFVDVYFKRILLLLLGVYQIIFRAFNEIQIVPVDIFKLQVDLFFFVPIKLAGVDLKKKISTLDFIFIGNRRSHIFAITVSYQPCL